MKLNMTRLWRLGLPAILMTAALAATARDALACAMCGLPPGDIATHAYNTSVLFMMAVPYSIFLIGAVVGFFAYRNACKRRTDARGGLAPELPHNR